jgi:hypothetical protein
MVVRANDAVTRTTAAFQGLFRQLAVGIAPVVEMLADDLTGAVVDFRKTFVDNFVDTAVAAAKFFRIIQSEIAIFRLGLLDLEEFIYGKKRLPTKFAGGQTGEDTRRGQAKQLRERLLKESTIRFTADDEQRIRDFFQQAKELAEKVKPGRDLGDLAGAPIGTTGSVRRPTFGTAFRPSLFKPQSFGRAVPQMVHDSKVEQAVRESAPANTEQKTHDEKLQDEIRRDLEMIDRTLRDLNPTPQAG